MISDVTSNLNPATAGVGVRHHVTWRELLLWQVFLILISVLSHYLRSITDSLLLYLPIAFSIILIHWYGWRSLIIIYVNAIITLLLWKAQGQWWWILLLATHEPVIAIASKLLIDKLIRIHYKDFFSNSTRLTLFILYGILIPVSLNSVYVYNYSFIRGDLGKVALFWLADFITVLAVSIPLLHFLQPDTKRILARYHSFLPDNKIQKQSILEFGLMLSFFIFLNVQAPFDKYWFIYWIGAVIVAVRLGFRWAILINLAIFILNYIFPLITILPFDFIQGSTQLASVHLGNVTMMFIALLVGRVVSDLRFSEENLVKQKAEIEKTNKQLRQANQELDRFVYSVSHDLSSPLKSIKGLINISKLEPSISPMNYLDKIESSVTKLEEFISEVLDYSQTNRKHVKTEDVDLKSLHAEILEKFTYMENFNQVQFRTEFLAPTLRTDKFLLKVILSNLISNAIKYQQTHPEHEPFIMVSSRRANGLSTIEVKDNGEGIRAEHKDKIFDMFYRGTANSSGSGLGLYIAHEAVQRLGGTIKFDSVFGEGSVLTLELKEG